MKVKAEIPLRDVPRADWQAEYDKLVATPYLQKKYDRNVRLREHFEYIREFCPEVMQSEEGMVVDCGCGAGEFLEIARHFDREILGIEAASGSGGMGDDYLRLSHLMHERQKIPMNYGGWLRFVERLRSDLCCMKIALLNFRGSLAQCYAEFVDGPPHHQHHDVSKQRWRFDDDLRATWLCSFEAMKARLVDGGHILIVANRLGEQSGQDQYCREIRAVAEEAGLELVKHLSNYVHKWR